MEHLLCEAEGELLLIKMARGKANAISAAMIGELTETIQGAASDGAVRGVVLASANPRFFSAGFDVQEVFAYDRPAMAEFFGRFTDLMECLGSLPKPAVAAIGGHALAGGAILALGCDARVMAEGEYGFALNEINLGIVVTRDIIQMTNNAVGVAAAREILLCGETIAPARALALGLAAELTPPETLLKRAVARARGLASKPPTAFAKLKRALRGPVERGSLDAFLDNWFSPECESQRRGVVDLLATR